MPTADLIFKAVAHPARRQVISLLSERARSVKDFTAAFPISQTAISQQLRDADLVASDRGGLEQHYRLTALPLKSVYDWSSQYRTLFDPSGHAWTFTSTRPALQRR